MGGWLETALLQNEIRRGRDWRRVSEESGDVVRWGPVLGAQVLLSGESHVHTIDWLLRLEGESVNIIPRSDESKRPWIISLSEIISDSFVFCLQS